MDSTQTSSVTSWPEPRSVKELQSFLGFSNFYRQFIDSFAALCMPLYSLTRKGVEFDWTDACKQSFAALKHAFVAAPVLATFDSSLPIIVEADASDFAIGAIISQTQEDGEHYSDFLISRSTENRR